MFSITESIQRDYVAAVVTSPGQNKFSFSLNLFILVLKTILLTLVELVRIALSIFVPQKSVSIANQLALVTGGANGMGKAFCTRLAQEGCDLAIVDIDIRNARETAREIHDKFNVQCKAYQCDVSDYEAVEELKGKIENDMRAVDILVLNAGLLYMDNFIKSDIKDIQKTVDVNLTSQLMFTRLFLPSMIAKRYGRIVSICSILAKNTLALTVTYSTTKWGVDGFMNALYDELCASDFDEFIKLTTVYPDFVSTRKELSDMLDVIKHWYNPLTPERVADETIRAVLKERRELVVSDLSWGHVIVQKLPDRVRKQIKTSLANLKPLFNEK